MRRGRRAGVMTLGIAGLAAASLMVAGAASSAPPSGSSATASSAHHGGEGRSASSGSSSGSSHRESTRSSSSRGAGRDGEHGHGAPLDALPLPGSEPAWSPGPLPMLPSIGRVRVEAGRERTVVIEEIELPKGEWRSGSIAVYAAFGAPGTPLAVDAHWITPAAATGEARADDTGERVPVEPAPRRRGGEAIVLGRPTMAGVVLRVKESQLRQTFATSELGVLRIRSLLPTAGTDPNGARDVVVRLGTASGTPMTLRRIQVVSSDATARITRVEASLCGSDADPWPLAVAIPMVGGTPGKTAPVDGRWPIPPGLAVRHATDDVCLRWWTIGH